MSGRSIQHGTADVSTVIRIIDSTAGTPENAVEHDTAGIDLWYRREEATKTSITEAALATLDAAHSDGGIELIGDGYYRLDLPDLACAAGVAGVAVGGTITGMIVIGTYHPLVAYNPQDAVRLGLTALPNAAADAAGGLAISDAGGLDLDALNTAAIRLTAARAQVLDDWINAGRLDAILDIIAADVVNIDGDAMRGTDSAATAAKLLSYVQLMCRSDDAIETDNATELTEINTDEGSGAGAFSNETDGLEGLRDRGDQAWLTGAGGSATASYTTTTWARTVGDNDGGAGSDTTTVNATYFSTGETGAGTYLEVDATFDITDGELARSINIWGKYDGGGAHYMRVQARNYTDSTWEDIGIIGQSGDDLSYAFTLTPDHTDATGDQVQIKFLHAGGNGNGSHTFDIDKAQVNTATPAVNLTAAEVVDEWETQSQADPTGFHVNVKEVSDTAQTANDNGADINTLVTRVTTAVATAAELAKVPKSDGTASWNATALAAMESEANDALVAQKLDHLVAVADADDVVDDSIIAKLAASDADWSGFDNTADSLEAIRDRGDAAWATGGGGSISDILNVSFLMPTSIDLAGTATVRLGLMLTNAVDDLPSTAEITPGTISIDRKAIGGTSWSSVVSDAACSEAAGHIYYDEVFDSGTGYAEGDSLRITLKSQKITVAANDYEITDATGIMWQTEIRQTMRGTDSAATATELAKVPKSDGTSSWNATALAAINGEADTALSDYDPPTNTEMTAAFTEIKGATWASGTDTLEHIRNKQTDIETDTAQIGVAGAGLTEAGGDGDHLTESGGTGDQLTALATAAEVAKVPKSDDSVTWNATALASIKTEADTALSDYDPPTNAEMEARTPTAAQLLYIVENAATGVPVTFTTSGGSTTAAVINEIDGVAGSATDDQYNSRLLVFTDGTLKGVVTDITDYDGGTTTATITAIPVAPTSSHNARLI